MQKVPFDTWGQSSLLFNSYANARNWLHSLQRPAPHVERITNFSTWGGLADGQISGTITWIKSYDLIGSGGRIGIWNYMIVENAVASLDIVPCAHY